MAVEGGQVNQLMARTSHAGYSPGMQTRVKAMAYPVTADPVLVRLRQSLNAVYGDRIERVVLFGSRARGDARDDSDYDVAVFLKQTAGLWEDLGRLAHITTDILFDTGAVISAKPFAARLYAEPSPLMREIRTNGIDL